MRPITVLPTTFAIQHHGGISNEELRTLTFPDARRGLAGAFLSVFVSRKHA